MLASPVAPRSSFMKRSHNKVHTASSDAVLSVCPQDPFEAVFVQVFQTVGNLGRRKQIMSSRCFLRQRESTWSFIQRHSGMVRIARQKEL